MDKKFSDVLRDTEILQERKEICPDYREGTQKIEISAIVTAFTEEGVDFDKLENDIDVFETLSKCTPYDAKYILKNCLRQFQISCDDAKLNKLKTDRVTTLFFNIFDVYPKADVIVPVPPAPNESDTGKIDISQFKEKIFPDGVEGKHKISYADIEDILPEKIFDAQSLKNLLMSSTHGSIGKKLFKKCCESANLSYHKGNLNGMMREKYVPIFFDVFEIDFPAREDNVEPSPVENVATENVSLTFEQVQAIYNSAKKQTAYDLDFDLCGEVNFFENMPVTLKDKFWVKAPKNYPITYSCAAIINSQTNEVTAVGHIENDSSSDETLATMIFDVANINYRHFERQRRFNVMLLPKSQENFLASIKTPEDAAKYSDAVYIMDFQARYYAAQITDKPLCIDFGTSNTTAGTYGLGDDENEVQLVTFRDVTLKVPANSEMLPTIIYVDSFKDDEPVYKFGYEAKKEIMDADYNTRASVFYEIKRWINSMDDSEELLDAKGLTIPRRFRHKEILKAYLDYVITTAEQQFKVKFHKLHFTAPVKLKSHFLKLMRELYPEPQYQIEKDDRSLDEGIAVVYHYITTLMPNLKDEDAPKGGNILILDCGGGTTDLASCSYSIEKADYWHKLNIKTGFENGDSNFGGNNITFRILQMLKIKIASHLLRQGNLTMQELIEDDEITILSKIDSDYAEKDKIYKKFLEVYEAAEYFIPTKFDKYTGHKEKERTKRNYYYLWQMAEAIKIEFYRSNLVNFDLHKEENKKICVDTPAQYYLFVRKNNSDMPDKFESPAEALIGIGKLKSAQKNSGDTPEKFERPMDKVEITIKEINRIICPDIYALMTTLLKNYLADNSEELYRFRYRLSGQSCKIALFHDLMKEFIPGRLIRPHINEKYSGGQIDSSRLKKFCIQGSIEYMRDKARGEIRPVIDRGEQKNIYSIHIAEGEKKLFCLLNQKNEVAVIKRPNNTREAVFTVKDNNSIEKRRINYAFNMDESQPRYDIDKLEAEICMSTSLDADIVNEKILRVLKETNLERENAGKPIFCLFTVPARNGYGFYIWQVLVRRDERGKYYRAPEKPKFEAFEDDSLHTFFNGDK